MAMARKCDRCGGFYDEYLKKKRFTDPVNAIAFVQRTERGNWTGDNKDAFDLCPDCLNDVADYVLGKEKRE